MTYLHDRIVDCKSCDWLCGGFAGDVDGGVRLDALLDTTLHPQTRKATYWHDASGLHSSRFEASGHLKCTAIILV